MVAFTPAGMGAANVPISSTGMTVPAAGAGAASWQSNPSSVVVSPGSILRRPTSSKVETVRENVSFPATWSIRNAAADSTS